MAKRGGLWASKVALWPYREGGRMAPERCPALSNVKTGAWVGYEAERHKSALRGNNVGLRAWDVASRVGWGDAEPGSTLTPQESNA